MKIEFYIHNIGEQEARNVKKALDSIFLTTGSTVSEFERAFSSYLGAKNTVGLMSCTAGLHLSLLACGIGPGDEVITTPMSFIATSNAILHAGAKPVFVDIEPETGNIDAGLIEPAINKKTKAILPVHLYGQMCDMRKISRIACENKLKVIEDCAHCVEGQRDGVRPGQLADAAAFSFYATKSLTSGEGGAVTTNKNAIADKIRRLSLHGMSRSAEDRYSKSYEHWDMDVLGWKYNMDNIKAALLLSQVERLDEQWCRRKRIYDAYFEGFKSLRGVKMPRVIGKSGLHLFTIQVDPAKRDKMLGSLQEKGIGVAVNYRSIHTLKFYKKEYGFEKNDFPIAARFGASTISLPFYPKLTDADVRYVIDSVRRCA